MSIEWVSGLLEEDDAGSEAILTIGELATLLKVPVKTIYRWRTMRTGPPSFRCGRHVRYRRSDVIKWIEQQMTA